jgi:tetratricopeptide (TPR) repeat protein
VCGYPQYEAIATGNIGRDLLAVGRLAEARVQFERYRELSRKIGDRSCEGDALDGLAGVASESGDAETAESLLGELMDSSRSIGARSSEADALAARGLLRLRSGRRDEARTDFEAALSLGTGLTLPAVELRCRTRLASLPGGDVAAAVAAIAALRDRVPVREAMDAHLLVGKAAGDVAHLREAKRILDFIVAHAPADCRESMLLRIRAYREVVEACEEHGLAASPA